MIIRPDVMADAIHYEKLEIESNCLYHLQSWQEGVSLQCWHWNAPVELPCDITVCDGKISWCWTHAFFNKFLQLSAMISYSCMYKYWGKLMKDISRSAFQRCWRRRRDTAAKEIKSDQDQVGGGRKLNAEPPMALMISTELIIVLKQTTQIHPFNLLNNWWAH